VAVTSPELAGLASHHDSATVARLHADLGNGQARGDTPFETCGGGPGGSPAYSPTGRADDPPDADEDEPCPVALWQAGPEQD